MRASISISDISSGTFSRRGILGAALASGAASLFRRIDALAAPGPQPSPGDAWPPCDATITDYCVESLTVNGEDRLQELWTRNQTSWDGLGYSVSCGWNGAHPELPNLAGISFYESSGALRPEDLDLQIAAVIRTGAIEPQEVAAFATGFDRTVSGNAEDGWKVAISGSPTIIDWQGTPEWSFMTFRATLYTADPSPDYQTAGFWMAAGGANSYSSPWFDGDAWTFWIGGTDYDHDGSYRAWLSDAMLGWFGLSAAQIVTGHEFEIAVNGASAAGASVTRLTDPVYGDGILLDIPHLTIAALDLDLGAMSRRSARAGGKVSIPSAKASAQAISGATITIRAAASGPAPQPTPEPTPVPQPSRPKHPKHRKPANDKSKHGKRKHGRN